MAKKNEEKKAEAEVLAPINPLTVEFGNEGLNQLRDKLNELISRQ